MNVATEIRPTFDTDVRTAEPCLAVDGLDIAYGTGTPVVSDFSLTVAPGETVGLIGESGCGKSSVGLALLGLLPDSAQVSARTLDIAGQDVLGATDRDFQKLRGREIGMIFQEPMSALNPCTRIGIQIAEVLRLHGLADKKTAQARALELLQLVQVPEPELRMKQFPHQLSGGMRQRIVIAMALAARPKVLVADEPTTALDVTVQAQILRLLAQIQQDSGAGMVLISHDLGVIAETCDRVVVMYAGQIIEQGTPEAVLSAPAHPYTAGLLASIPTLAGDHAGDLPTIPGGIAAEDRARPGCRFAPRCALAGPECEAPLPLEALTGSHDVRCVKSLVPVGYSAAIDE
ncbi:ABC transporter ATP-binding protein [Rhodococcus gannanensis]|uniref:ABC transporter ATP-binding protein n=1 Tax=Rhodococcus gannanensis TaxID=1960308 RepID=A0ABW4P0G3_9NOCA